MKKKSFWERSALIRHYLWEYRGRISIGLLSLLCVDLLEIVPPIILKKAVDSVVEAGSVGADLLGFALAYAAVSIVQGICRFGWRVYVGGTSMLAGRDLRNKYAGHLFGLSATFFDRSKVGDLMSLATNDTEAVRRALGPGVIILADAIIMLTVLPIAMLMLSWKLTLIVLVPLLIVPFIVIRNEREIHVRFERVQACFSKLSALAQEGITGIRLVKAYTREDVQVKRFGELGKEYLNLSMHLARVQTSFGPTLDFVMSLGLVVLIFVGGSSVIADSITLGTFVAFQRYIHKMAWPMTAVGLAVAFFQRGLASSERIQKILDEKSDILKSDHPALPESANQIGSWKTDGKVEFKNLSFKYNGSNGKRDVFSLKNINLTVEPGERIAIMGTIGSGKSSLLALVPRLYPVPDGMIFVDGVDVNAWPLEELRGQIGYVAQEVFLFSQNVTENVSFGFSESMTMAEEQKNIQQFTQMAQVDEEIRQTAKGYGTILGERGVNLSGGQKQRLTIARALAQNPSILILDDALSAIDVETEDKILNRLRARSHRNTELVAAHRISTVQDADKIVVLNRGEIVEQGKHQDLIQKKTSLYWKFYEQQRLKEELDSYVRELEEKEELGPK